MAAQAAPAQEEQMSEAADSTTETSGRSRSKTAASPKFTIVETKEPAYSVSPRNPLGDILTIRAPMIVYLNADGTIDEKLTANATFDLFKALVDPVVGAEWPDSVRTYLASFDPAVVQMMRDGIGVEEALDLKDPSSAQAAAYKRLSSGGGRGSSDGGGGRGGSGGGGGSTSDLLDLEDMSDSDYEALPKALIDELTKGTRCPSCGSHKFWDNRGSDKGGPKFACANKDCEGGGKKRQGGYFPWGWFGAQQNQGGGRDSGGGRRSRGD